MPETPEVSGTAAPCCPPLTERPLTADEAERTATMFKALGDPVRLRLLSEFAAARRPMEMAPARAVISSPRQW